MRIKADFFTSYDTHTYCAKCEIWKLRSEWNEKNCETCHYKLRQKTRYSSKDKYEGAY